MDTVFWILSRPAVQISNVADVDLPPGMTFRTRVEAGMLDLRFTLQPCPIK